MESRTARYALLAAVVLLAGNCYGGSPRTTVQPEDWVEEIRTVREQGGRLDWSHKTGLIAFDMVGADGYYDVYTMNADGGEVRGLTVDHPDLPRRHIGQPAWHPSGDYIVFQAQKEVHPKLRLKRVVEPGAGVYNDLWLMEIATNRVHPIRVVPSRQGAGILHAHFSKDGRRLSWSEMYRPGKLRGKRNLLGHWRLMTADFSFERGKPRLKDVRSYEPGDPGFYENHGFSPDGKKLLFTSNFEGVSRLNAHIYTLDLESGLLTQLTDDKQWNEHAAYSPDSKHIVWIRRNDNRTGTDYWIMNADGSGKRRLTFFNEKGHAHHSEETVVVADLAWGPDGDRLLAYKRMGGGLEKSDSPRSIVMIKLDSEQFE